MLTVKATNINQHLDGTADYAVEVRTSREVLFFGTVKGHDRKKGWRQLLRDIAAQEEPYAKS